MSESNATAVALLCQTGQLGGHLKDALAELGAAVVYEAAPAAVDREALENSNARVVIVNLDADSDSYIDALYEVLDAGDYEVLFNDAQVSSNLQGWDQARWVRHLAAKVLRRPEMAEPPRPPGAQAVPTPVQKSAMQVPVAEKPGPALAEPVATVIPKPPAPPERGEAEVPASERPTVKMQVPAEFREAPAPEPAAPTDLDVAELEEFARLIEPQPAEPAPTAAAASTPVAMPEFGDFAAELDALFAGAEKTAPDAIAAPPKDEFDIALPAEFDLTLDEPPATVEPIAAHAAAAPRVTSAFASADAADQQDEFPAVFDKLDAAAADVPQAMNPEFKPAERPAAQPEPEQPAPAPEWSLQEDDVKLVAGKANFGIEKVSAEEYLAPQVDETAKPAPTAEPSFLLELVPLEEAVAPTQHNPDYVHEQRLEAGPAKPLRVGAGAVISRVVVLGASIGGPEAVRDYLGALPAGFPALFIVAQHMGEEFLELMSAQLRKAIAMTVRNPTHGERAAHGDVLVVPTTHRLQVDAEGVITLAHLPEKTPYSPSIDQVLRDVADAFGANAGAIIFSGMAHDAIEGSQYLKSRGGRVWAQDPDTCVVSSMIEGARAAGAVEFIGSAKQLAAKTIAEYGKA